MMHVAMTNDRNMRQIHITDETWKALASFVIPFEDKTEDDVIRKLIAYYRQHVEQEGDSVVQAARTIVAASPPTRNGESNLGQVTLSSTPIINLQPQRANPKQVGRENRRRYLQFLKEHQGISLEHEERTAYLLPSGIRVLIPCANPYAPNKWFLGAPKRLLAERPNVALTLLCMEREEFLDFIFSASDVARLLNALTDVAGEIKFNVRRDDGKYSLYRPRLRDKMDITPFLHSYKNLG